jgi:hypothetical protein
MFLARAPLMDLASQLIDGISSKRKVRKTRKVKTSQKDTEAAI